MSSNQRKSKRKQSTGTLQLLLFPVIVCVLISGSGPLVVANPAIFAGPLFQSITADKTMADIQLLAADDFETRQSACQRLVEQGSEAWDFLFLARRSSNQEIASTANRLWQQIDFQKQLTQHSPLLANYQTLKFSGRARRIIHLGRTSRHQDQMALALIARFEHDEFLSRCAAIELLESNPQDMPAVAAVLRTSPRLASRWLRTHARAVVSPEHFARLWQPLIDQLRHDSSARHQPDATRRLLQWYAEQLLVWSPNDEQRCHQVAIQVVDSLRKDPVRVIETFDWLLLHRMYEACDYLSQRFDGLMHSDSRLTYRCAELAFVQGDYSVANRYAALAIQAAESDPVLRLQQAINLQLAGLDHWAASEMSLIIAEEATPPSVRIQVAALLAEIKYQQQQYEAAAKILNVALRQKPEKGESAVSLLNDPVCNMDSRRCYFRHLQAIDEGDWPAAKQFLLSGLQAAPEDSDLLIAMSRFLPVDDEEPVNTDEFGETPASKQWRTTTLELIELALQHRQENIESLRSAADKDPRMNRLRQGEMVEELNGYAWLASQTGVHLAEAESMAREAMEAAPGNCHVLDTLAACLYSQDRFNEAVAVQRQALRHAPFSRPIRFELARYRQAMMVARLPSFFR